MDDSQATKGPTLLIVDDEEMLVELVCRMVQRRGFDTITATNATEALQIYEERASEIGLVITDLMMPGMDGRALATQLLARNPTLRILVSTGYSSSNDLSDVRAMGIRGVVLKPYQSEQLLAMVDQALAD